MSTMNNTQIILFNGPPGSGKDTAVDYWNKLRNDAEFQNEVLHLLKIIRDY